MISESIGEATRLEKQLDWRSNSIGEVTRKFESREGDDENIYEQIQKSADKNQRFKILFS
ncbi:hypothetical protein [Vibrio splendidus]|uniref:hypothetical protein n=1 Tax=Vibrio splendidus TaxID=29497 RepID=UPI000C863536|nr:hypothetical protein [Vibrio splendidus]PMM37062.1 hypothetical protein BCT55_10495 [Vibrio splendidus]PTP62826.1 hypothetical protein CWO31_18010 [Vibrio splendidus]